MINAEKYKSEILEIINNGRNFATTKNSNEIKPCSERSDRECSECLFSACNNEEGCKFGCDFYKLNWLLSEYKELVKLSRVEYELLKFFSNKGYKYIARDSGDGLGVYISKQHKDFKVWKTNRRYIGIGLLWELFQFVKWEDEEPTSIKDVLENCIVLEEEAKHNDEF